MVDRGSLDFNKNLAHVSDNIRAQAPVDRKTVLPIDFRPSAYDVICARGKTAWNHVGNRRFRTTVDINLDRYKAATTKVQKSLIVMEIVDLYRENSPRGGFVRQDSDTKRWHEVGDAVAREKVGQSLRELLLQQDPEKHTAKKTRKASLKKARRESKKRAMSPAVSPVQSTKKTLSLPRRSSSHSSSSSLSSTALDDILRSAIEP